MASIQLYGVWIAPADDLGDQLVLNAAVSLTGSKARAGEVRTYADGRQRLILGAAAPAGASVSAARVDRTTREWLDSHIGDLMLLRDGRGRLLWGSYLALDAEEQPGLPYSSLSFDFLEVSHSVEV
jgi:hypothetical protein